MMPIIVRDPSTWISPREKHDCCLYVCSKYRFTQLSRTPRTLNTRDDLNRSEDDELMARVGGSGEREVECFLHPYVARNVFRAMLAEPYHCLLYTSPSPRDQRGSRMPSSA